MKKDFYGIELVETIYGWESANRNEIVKISEVSNLPENMILRENLKIIDCDVVVLPNNIKAEEVYIKNCDKLYLPKTFFINQTLHLADVKCVIFDDNSDECYINDLLLVDTVIDSLPNKLKLDGFSAYKHSYIKNIDNIQMLCGDLISQIPIEFNNGIIITCNAEFSEEPIFNTNELIIIGDDCYIGDEYIENKPNVIVCNSSRTNNFNKWSYNGVNIYNAYGFVGIETEETNEYILCKGISLNGGTYTDDFYIYKGVEAYGVETTLELAKYDSYFRVPIRDMEYYLQFNKDSVFSFQETIRFLKSTFHDNVYDAKGFFDWDTYIQKEYTLEEILNSTYYKNRCEAMHKRVKDFFENAK